jgi:hypothetical protein
LDSLEAKETETERDKDIVEFSRWNQISHWLTCNHERRRHSPFGKRQLGRQYNKEFQLSLALFLSSAEGIEKEQSTLWKGRKLLFPSISRNKK